MTGSAATIGQSSFDGLWWLCLVILIGIFIGAVYFIYWLGKLPGETAAARGHSQASAIAVSGWLGLLFPPLWVVALVWAYLVPADRPLQPPPDLESIQATMKATAARVAQIERQIGRVSVS